MFKLLAEGEVRWLCWDIAKVVAAVTTIASKDKVAMPRLLDMLEHATPDFMSKLRTEGCEFYTSTQSKSQLMYLPAGWMASEIVTSGVLVYGARKTLFVKSSSHKDSYEELMGLYTNAGKQISKMVDASAVMDPEESSS